MKKVTILLAAVIGLGGVASAQRLNNLQQSAGSPTVHLQDSKTGINKSHEFKKASTAVAPGDTIFKEDFRFGISPGYGNTGYYTKTGTKIQTTGLWKWYPNADTSRVKGAFSKGLADIQSPTANNGFILFDSDYYDNGGDAANSGKGPFPAKHLGTLTIPVNCSGRPGVILEFNDFITEYVSNFYVKVKNGAGDSIVFDANTNPVVGVNTVGSRTSHKSLNISSIAANQANVEISFIFDGATTMGASGYGLYFWELDDIILLESKSNDLVFEGSGVSFDDKISYYNNTSALHQVDTLKYNSETYNNGVNTQRNVQTLAKVSHKGNIIATAQSRIDTIATNKRDTIFDDQFDPKYKFISAAKFYNKVNLADTGNYVVDLAVVSSNADEDTTNNRPQSYSFNTTSGLYSLDDLGPITESIGTDFNRASTSVAGFSMANAYEFLAQDTITSLTVWVSARSTEGSTFEVQILGSTVTTGANPGRPIPNERAVLAQSDPVVLGEPTDPIGYNYVKGTPQVYTIPLQSPLVVAPGRVWASVYSYVDGGVNTTDTLRIGDESRTQNTQNASQFFLPGPTGGWYTNPKSLYIRANMKRGATGIASAVSKNGSSLSQNVPNPFNGVSTINYSVASTEKVTLVVTDVTGRKVAEINEGVKAAGAYQISLNAADFNKGIYFYTLKVGATSLTKKMVITQ